MRFYELTGLEKLMMEQNEMASSVIPALISRSAGGQRLHISQNVDGIFAACGSTHGHFFSRHMLCNTHENANRKEPCISGSHPTGGTSLLVDGVAVYSASTTLIVRSFRLVVRPVVCLNFPIIDFSEPVTGVPPE